ncbi:MAG: hypothetical protein ACFBRM_01840 [Pikeienuella sp.]
MHVLLVQLLDRLVAGFAPSVKGIGGCAHSAFVNPLGLRLFHVDPLVAALFAPFRGPTFDPP